MRGVHPSRSEEVDPGARGSTPVRPCNASLPEVTPKGETDPRNRRD